MKKILWLLFLTGFVPVLCKAEVVSETPINKVAQGVDFTQSIDVGKYDRFSVQVTYSSTTATVPAATTVSDGNISSDTLVVTDYASLNGQGASGTITLESGYNTSAIDLAVVTLGSKKFTEGTDWDRLETSTATMADLQAAIDADWEYVATVSSNVVTITYYASGTSGNGKALTASTARLQCSAATITGGQAYGYLNINGTTLTEGTDWDAATSSAVTANSIEDAINANATLAAIMTATHSTTGQVLVTSDLPGVNLYPVSVSNASYLTPRYYRFYGGAASDVLVSGDTFAETSHGFSTGLPVLFATVSGTAPTGLTTGTTYYAIKVNSNSFQLSDTSTGAVAGLDIDITALTYGGSFTVTPLAFVTGSAGFKWRASNDNSNFVDVDVDSVTYSANGNSAWNFTDYTYKYLQMDFTAPTTGGLDIEAILFGRIGK